MICSKLKYRRLKFLVLFVFGCFTCAIASAEQTGKKQLLPLEERMKKEISVEFRNIPIEDALMLMADQADVDIVKSPSVTGEVTVKLTDVPLDEALDNILAAYGYGYKMDKNMIRVVSKAEIAAEKEQETITLVTKTYRITYADVTEVATALEKFKSAEGSVTYVRGTSNIIVTDTESKMKEITNFIKEIDRVTPQVLVEARIYDISMTDQMEVGIEWFIGRNTSYGTAGPGGVGTNPVTKRDSPSYHSRTDPFATVGFNSAISKTPRTDGLIRFGILDPGIDIDVLLTANREIICAKLLACPRVLVLDNEQATFKIVEELPFQQLTQTTEGGNIGTTQFKEVGVELTVTPHIAPEQGKIRLQLAPKFSVQTDTVSIVIPIAGAAPITSPQPVVATREADTKVLVNDGQTVVLGGLRKRDVAQEISKIPLLGDMPILGRLFKFEGEKVVNSELLVFVTPKIVTEPVMTELEQHYYDKTETETCVPECPPTKVGDCTD